MTSYFVTTTSLPAHANSLTLLNQLKAAGLPVTDVQTSNAYPGQVIVVSNGDLSPAQQTQMNSTVAAWDPRPRTKRPLYLIYNDLTALTPTQQGNAWTDLSSGSPLKYLLDSGANTAAIAVMDWVIQNSGATGVALTNARLRIAAMYVQDNPKYLVAPTFDPAINVSGDVPAP